MLTIERLRELVDDVECEVDEISFRWNITLAWESKFPREVDPYHIGFFIQLEYDEPDIHTGKIEPQRALKWFIDKEASDGEVYQRMLRAHLASAEHRVREHFKVKGELIYGPHMDAAELIAMLKRDADR